MVIPAQVWEPAVLTVLPDGMITKSPANGTMLLTHVPGNDQLPPDALLVIVAP
jgi:hypothetical protein